MEDCTLLHCTIWRWPRSRKKHGQRRRLSATRYFGREEDSRFVRVRRHLSISNSTDYRLYDIAMVDAYETRCAWGFQTDFPWPPKFFQLPHKQRLPCWLANWRHWTMCAVQRKALPIQARRPSRRTEMNLNFELMKWHPTRRKQTKNYHGLTSNERRDNEEEAIPTMQHALTTG